MKQTDLKPWRLICPPKNWREPVLITENDLSLLHLIGVRLNLVLTRDDKRKKIYLGNAFVSESDHMSGLRFPSGWTVDVIDNEDADPKYTAVNPTTAAPLIRAFPDAQISKNFRLSEFRPGEHSYKLIRLSPKLINTLEDIRERAGGYQLHVNSGYRPPAYNRKVGGVFNSFHIDGLAADIDSDHLSTEELYDICDRVIGDRGGVGYYPDLRFVHVDIRGYRARW